MPAQVQGELVHEPGVAVRDDGCRAGPAHRLGLGAEAAGAASLDRVVGPAQGLDLPGDVQPLVADQLARLQRLLAGAAGGDPRVDGLDLPDD